MVREVGDVGIDEDDDVAARPRHAGVARGGRPADAGVLDDDELVRLLRARESGPAARQGGGRIGGWDDDGEQVRRA